MKLWDVVTDIILYGTWGILFYRLLLLLEPKASSIFTRRQWQKAAVCVLPFFLWRGLIGYCMPVQRFFLGEMPAYQSSRTILTTGLGLLILFLSGCFLYGGKKRQILYLTLLFGALSEMLRFGFYCLTIWFPNGAMDCFLNRIENGSMEMDSFYQMVSVVQIVWIMVYILLYLISLTVLVHYVRQAYLAAGRLPKDWELLYLTASPLISLGFGILMRSIMLIYRKGEIYSIFDENKGLYLLIPAIAALCIGMMLGSVRTFSHIVEEERKKSELLIYQGRVEDMEQYVGDLERMQDGIRGMKHDIRNYMEDIRALMALGEDSQGQKELNGYLSGMERTLQEFNVRYKTGNPVTDVLLNRHMVKARELGVSVDWAFSFPGELNIDPFDMSIILNNGLNNALESCEKLPKEQRWVTLRGFSQGKMFLMEIKNAAREGDQVTPDLGMKNMMRCVEKYCGHMEWGLMEGEFRLTVLLQGNSSICKREGGGEDQE